MFRHRNKKLELKWQRDAFNATTFIPLLSSFFKKPLCEWFLCYFRRHLLSCTCAFNWCMLCGYFVNFCFFALVVCKVHCPCCAVPEPCLALLCLVWNPKFVPFWCSSSRAVCAVCRAMCFVCTNLFVDFPVLCSFQPKCKLCFQWLLTLPFFVLCARLISLVLLTVSELRCRYLQLFFFFYHTQFISFQFHYPLSVFLWSFFSALLSIFLRLMPVPFSSSLIVNLPFIYLVSFKFFISFIHLFFWFLASVTCVQRISYLFGALIVFAKKNKGFLYTWKRHLWVLLVCLSENLCIASVS